jgi:hypothetical protein
MTPDEWYALDFPYEDDTGTVWLDPSGFHAPFGTCFICKLLTSRVDIDYQGHYCGSSECEEAIRKNLERANGGPESDC